MSKRTKQNARRSQVKERVPDILKDHPLFRFKKMADEAARSEPGVAKLVRAAREGNVAAVKRLLAEGLSPNQIPPNDPEMETAVWAAVYRRKPAVIRVLAEGGADLDEGFPNTPLQVAAQWGHLGLVRTLIEGGADVNRANNSGETAILLAVEEKRVEVVGELLKAGAKPNYVPRAGRREEQMTPLQLAAYEAGPPILELLLEAGATEPGLDTLLLCGAACRGDVDAVKALLARGVDVNAKDSSDRTPLHYAAQTGKERIVRLLLDHGADSDLSAGKKGKGESPLMMAAAVGKVEVAQMLVEAGADPDYSYRPFSGSPQITALTYAKHGRQKKMVEYLLGLKKKGGGKGRKAPASRPTGVPTFDTNDSCVLVDGEVEAVARALKGRLRARVWEEDVLGKKVKLTKRCYAVFRIVGQPWSAVMRLNCDDVRHYLGASDAESLSKSLKSRAILVANSDTGGVSQYVVFDCGKPVELFDSGSTEHGMNRAAVVKQFAKGYHIDLDALPNLQVAKGRVFGSSLRNVKLSSIKNDLDFISDYLKSQNAFAPLFPEEWGRAGDRVELTLEGLGPDDIERLDYVAV